MNLAATANLPTEDFFTVYSVLISETDFMRFNRENGASPATMVNDVFRQ